MFRKWNGNEVVEKPKSLFFGQKEIIRTVRSVLGSEMHGDGEMKMKFYGHLRISHIYDNKRYKVLLCLRESLYALQLYSQNFMMIYMKKYFIVASSTILAS